LRPGGFAEITDATLHAVPGQDGYHDTSEEIAGRYTSI
jgi:hypothetical protein